MPEPYASVIAILYGLGFLLLGVSLPARLKARRRAGDQKSSAVASAYQVDDAFVVRTSSKLSVDGKDAH